jgi:hypothetical protein
VQDERGFFDYSGHFARINKRCDDEGCDTILYALFTWDESSRVRTHDSIFTDLKHLQRIVLEVFKPPKSGKHVEIWVRGQLQPLLAHQFFARANDPICSKRQFMDELAARQVDSILLVICGETNIVHLRRATKTFDDPFGFMEKLKEMKTQFVLNPVHDYMRRYEMREKRRFYSKGGRTVFSVWNRGKGKEAWLPWTVFHDGHDVTTKRVQEIQTPFPERSDIRIGVYQVH